MTNILFELSYRLL